VTRWAVIALALIAGIWLLGYDQRTDDNGVEIALIIAIVHGNYQGVMALLVAGAGAFIGYAMRRGAATAAR